MEKISEKVLDTIKHEHLKPTARWKFILKNSLVWVFGVFSLIIGALAVAVIIFMMTTSEWQMFRDAEISAVQMLFLSLPYFWIVFLGIFIALVYFNLRHTKQGYKYKLYKIILGTILFSVLLGIFFFEAGIGQAMDDIFSKNMPAYGFIMRHRQIPWTMPEKGLLGGEIIEIRDDGIKIEDIRGNEWDIEKDAIEELIEFKKGMKIKMLGNTPGEGKFDPKQIKPFGMGIQKGWVLGMGVMKNCDKPGERKNCPRRIME